VQDSLTPSVDSAYNLSQKLLRFRNVWTDKIICEAVAFHSGGELNGIVFTRSYNQLRDKLELTDAYFVGLQEEVQTLSNALVYDYITTSDLNDQLTATYIQQYEK
jgi:hypothetical protein